MSLSYLRRLLKRDRPKLEKYADSGLHRPHLGDKNSFESLFWGHEGTIVHKWHHYLPVYEKFLSRYKNKPIKFLEIGVSRGGSLSLWRKYFGPDATIYGVDIDPRCKEYDGLDAQVRIGSQDDDNFMSVLCKKWVMWISYWMMVVIFQSILGPFNTVFH